MKRVPFANPTKATSAGTLAASRQTPTCAPFRAPGRRPSTRAEGGGATSRRHLLGTTAGLMGMVFFRPTAASGAEECDYTVAPNGLHYCDLVVGEGETPSAGTVIKAHYDGRLPDGTKFDSSYDRRRPLQFTVGRGQVIKGWDIGILGNEDIPPMRYGGKRKLLIPPELAYGKRGAGNVIPPDATLVFLVELVGKR